MTKKIVRKVVKDLDIYSFENSLKDVKEYVERLISEYGEDAALAIHAEDHIDVYLHKYSEETDAEYANRLAIERTYENAERKRYEELKKKYG